MSGARVVGLAAFSAMLVSFWTCLPPALGAEGPTELWQRCATNSEEDIRCKIPRGIAADPKSGHVFVADEENFRVVEFTSLGSFVRAWGWDVVESGPDNESTVPPEAPQFEICVPSNGDKCKSGISGTGEGQFGGLGLGAQGVALDSAGDIFVVDWINHRVEKFDPEGHFVSEFGSEGTGNGQFSWPETFIGSNIGIDTGGTEASADDKVYVGDVGRIQRFDDSGAYQSQFPAAGSVRSLAVDLEGNLYATYNNQPAIRKITPTGEELASPRFEATNPPPKENEATVFTAVAVDALGDVYGFGPPKCSGCTQTFFNPIYEFDSNGKVIANFGIEGFDGSTGLATNLCPGDTPPGNLYVSNGNLNNAFLRAYGPEPNNCGKAITGEATDITQFAATANGRVNPGGEAASACHFEYGTSTAYGNTIPCAESAGEIGTGTEPVPVHAVLSGLTKGTVYHLRLVFGTAKGTEAGSDTTFKTLGPPVLSKESASHIGFSEATLKATVNPEGFPAKYRFEYGPDENYGNVTSEIEVGSAGDRTDHPVTVNLAGLLPGATYHWRIVAVNLSGKAEGPDHTFTTYVRSSPGGCPNDAFRSGAAASLPDCRAYEMVSPVDKNGGDLVHPFEAWVQVSNDGDKITYSAAPAFGDVVASVNENQYLASRRERGQPNEGWSNHGIHPPVVGEHPVAAIVFGLFREFEGFSADLCDAWFGDTMTPPLTPEGQAGFVNHYRLDTCGEEGPEALTSVPPPEGTQENYVNVSEGQGIAGYSGDGSQAFFSAAAQLDEDAAPGTNPQIYDRAGGALHVVSIKNDGTPATEKTRVGSGASKNLDNAVSTDGEYVYWTTGGDETNPVGRIFVRKHPALGKAADECSEAEKPCNTLPVTLQGMPVKTGFFWTAAADGSKAIYGEPLGESAKAGEKLIEYDLAKAEVKEAARRTIASPAAAVLGASDDLSRVYFLVDPSEGSGDVTSGSTMVSDVKPSNAFSKGQTIEGAGIPVGTTVTAVGVGTMTLSAPATASGNDVALVAQNLPTAGQENSEGDVARIDHPNIYLDEGGTLTFVASPVAGDVQEGSQGDGRAYSLASKSPFWRATRITPDGAHIAFESRAPLVKGFDNTDPDTGEPLLEVYTYEAGGGLHCASCNPAGAAPIGKEMPEPFRLPFNSRETGVFAAAWIPTWEHGLDASHVISDDGSRLFFNSYDALVPADTNEAMDVYEWEAPGAGICKEGSPAFHGRNGGCLYLISSGQSSYESLFWDASSDGRDVFFSTESSLLPKDPGQVDLYDARVEGGFPEPSAKAECEGEACQSPPVPAQEQTPASATYNGPGNLPPSQKHKNKKKKQKHKKQKHAKRKAHHKQGAAR
jgi:hypothetical protein